MNKTNILVVEDKEEYQQKAISGIKSACGKNYTDLFNIEVAASLADTTNYIRNNINGNLITILDGYFPDLKGGVANKNYIYAIYDLEERKGKNFLIPYSSEKEVNNDMLRTFNKSTEFLCSGDKTQKSIEEAIKKYIQKNPSKN